MDDEVVPPPGAPEAACPVVSDDVDGADSYP